MKVECGAWLAVAGSDFKPAPGAWFVTYGDNHMPLHIFPSHTHDVACGDCSEPLRITCSGLAARYTEAACPIGTERHACAECVTKPRCEECGEVSGSQKHPPATCCPADLIDDDDARDRAIESGIARNAGGEA